MNMNARSPAPSTPFDELPAALQGEILRRIGWYSAIATVAVSVISLLLGLTVTSAVPGSIGFGMEFAARLGAAFLALLVAIVLSVLLIARGMAGWASILPARRIVELYGIDRADLSPKVFRSQMRKPGPWWHGLAGLVVTAGMIALVQALWQLVFTHRLGPPIAALTVGLVGYGVMIRAWQVRQVVGSLAAKGGGHVAELAPETEKLGGSSCNQI